MAIVGILQFVWGQLEGEYLLVDVSVRSAGVHLHLRVLLLGSQSVPRQPGGVAPPLTTSPAVLGHRLRPGPHLRVLTEDLRQPSPEAPRLLQLGDDVGDEVVEVGPGGRVGFPLHHAGELLDSEPKSLSFSHPGLATVLEHLQTGSLVNTDRNFSLFQLSRNCFSLQLDRIELNASSRHWFLYLSNFTAR